MEDDVAGGDDVAMSFCVAKCLCDAGYATRYGIVKAFAGVADGDAVYRALFDVCLSMG